MSKNFKKAILKIVLSLTVLTSFNYYATSNIYAEENKLDLLIANQEKQKELKEQISQVENTIKLKNKDLQTAENGHNDNDSKEKIEIVTVSFVPSEVTVHNEEVSELDIISSEVLVLEESKNDLAKKLQDTIIEGVQIEKTLEDEASEKMKENNQDFISGIWPLSDYKEISSAFGNRIHPITNKKSFHKGIDIPAPQDTSVLAIDDGIVSFSGYQNGYGNVVKIKHFDGKTTVYAHNNSNVVKQGDIVKRGQVISKVGTTGNSTGNHVHFEIVVNGENINPVEGVIK
ncbi:MAG: M23 family metallopeptidase [Peptostreptococcaceae bacterium]